MTSTTSSAKNKNAVLSMIISSIKKSGLLVVAYSFLLFIAFPIVVALSKGNKTPDKFNYIDCGVFNEFSTFVITIFTVIIAAVMFSIYHNKRSVDLYASLPLKRQSLFLAKYAAGLIMLIVPLVVFMIAGLVVSGNFTGAAVGMTFYKMLGFILAIVNGYSMIALLAMLCGGVIDTLVSYAVVNIGIAGSIALAVNLVALILPGYNNVGLYGLSLKTMALMLFSPLAMTNIVGEFSFTKTPYYYDGTNALADEIIIMTLWLAMAVAYFVAAMMIAKIRKNENVQSGFIFSFPKIAIQVIASVGIGLIAGFVAVTSFDVLDTTNGFTEMILFMSGALLGSLGAFLITTLLYNKGAKRFIKDLPVFVCSFVPLAVFYLLISLGLVGGVMNVPEVDEIKSVSLNSPAFNSYMAEGKPSFISVGDGYEKFSYASEDKQYIEKVVTLHQTIVDNLHNKMGTFFNMAWIYEEMPVSGPTNIEIVYELNNGEKIVKTYAWYNYDTKDIEEEYNAIINTESFKEINYKITKCETAQEANVSFVSIMRSAKYANNYVHNETTAENDVYDSEFINQIYSSLREEFIADKDLVRTMMSAEPGYIDPSIPDEIVYSLKLDYDVKSDIYEEMYDKIKKENGLDEKIELLIDKPEVYYITRESYPNTWQLIDECLESKNITEAFVYPDAA